jgi:FkbM family methyltransferase
MKNLGGWTRLGIPPRVRHWGKLAVQPEYRWRHREIIRLRKIARYTPAHTYLLGERLELVDAASFLALYEDLIERQVYRFEAGKSSPLIIDGGANIGVSVIYFKKLYPKSHIIAFEPDPEVFQVLKKNCEAFGIKDVETIPKALWTADTALEFKREGSDAGRISRAEDDSDLIRVQACRLNDYLDQKIDLLKLDIEGAETEVLKDCADRLSNIERVFVEYHSFADSPQSLNDLISVLHNSGFRLHMQCPMASAQPFVKRDTYLGMDFQVNIFAFRS